MKNIPDKCLKCGAPIKWDKTSNHIDCEYCGYTNLINNASSLKIKKFNKLSENIFQIVGTFSKNRFSKAKFLLNKNKKYIFISLLSISLFGGIFRKVKISLTFSPEKYCNIVPPGEYTSVRSVKPSIDSKFLGCWYKPIDEEYQKTGFFRGYRFIRDWNLPESSYQFMRIESEYEGFREVGYRIINYMYIAKDKSIISAKTSNISYQKNEKYSSAFDTEYVDEVLKFDLEWEYGDPQRREVRVWESQFSQIEDGIKLYVYKYNKLYKEGEFWMKRIRTYL